MKIFFDMMDKEIYMYSSFIDLEKACRTMNKNGMWIVFVYDGTRMMPVSVMRSLKKEHVSSDM